jgi:hypothetical protein
VLIWPEIGKRGAKQLPYFLLSFFSGGTPDMSLSTVVTITGPFVKLVADGLADLKRQRLADIDLDKLRLHRTNWEEKLEDCKAKLQVAVVQTKADATQDLISRGLGNSTVLDSKLRAIEQDAANKLNIAMREHNRAIEKIALMERAVKERTTSIWQRLFGRRPIGVESQGRYPGQVG